MPGLYCGAIRAEVEVQDLRQLDHAVEIDAIAGFQDIDQIGVARRAVAFAKKEFG